ncbi:MAG: glycosyltransferase [Candidatus Woesearchaeota archaeon]
MFIILLKNLALNTGFYVYYTFKELGFEVDNFSPFLAYLIKDKIKDKYFAYICVDDSSHYFFPPSLSPSVLWLIDTPFSFHLDMIMSKYFDIVFCAQKTFAEKLSSPKKKVEWLPLACYPKFHSRKSANKTYDLAFVGSLDKRRIGIKNILENEGLKIFFGQSDPQNIGKIYSSAKIVLNINKRFDLNMRVFEGMCAGSLMLSEDFDGRKDIFKEDQIVVFSSEDEMLEKIRYYLKNEEEREKIAHSGMREVLEKHTYMNRIKKILESLKNLECTPSIKKTPSIAEIILFTTLEVIRMVWIKSGMRNIVIKTLGPIYLP